MNFLSIKYLKSKRFLRSILSEEIDKPIVKRTAKARPIKIKFQKMIATNLVDKKKFLFL
jgi:hypothetical protein